ncbi:MAG: aryl-sulfate sulfotransferase [candidate division WOR-3 bacterium]|nr:MAG: aryl-sulfate sulfotransferase [candidate division WOR-3 bacterium]
MCESRDVLRPGLAIALVLALAPHSARAQERTMGLMYHDSTLSYQGYTLFSPMYYDVTYLIDNQGRLVRSWHAGSDPWYLAYLLEDGSLLHAGRFGRATGIRKRHWYNTLLWSFVYFGDSFELHHDLEVLPNGNVLSLARELRSEAEALASGRDTAKLTSMGLQSEHVIEVDTSSSEIVWRWYVWDHLVQDFDSTKRNWGSVRDHPELIDLNYAAGQSGAEHDFIHINAVDYNAGLDQVILSPRNYSEVWIIDHSTTTEEARGHSGGRYGRGGDLLYRWGNPQTYRRGDSLDQALFYQHDAQWIPDSLAGAGNLLAFNNGGSERRWSSVDEWIPPVDSPGFYHLGPDSAYGPVAQSWWYRDTVEFYSSHLSGCQRLPNGNTLVCEGMEGVLLEVTPDSQVVWKYINPVCDTGPMIQGNQIPPLSNEVFRAYRFSPDYSAFIGRNLEPGDPIERYPTGILAPKARAFRPTLSCPGVVRSGTPITVAVSSGHARLSIYDCTGREVATLVDEVLPAGRYELHWSTRDLASGSYFLKLTLGTATSTRPVVVTR